VNPLPWQIRGGFVVSGTFATERERMMAEAVNVAVAHALEQASYESYQRGVEDAKAIYRPRGWFGRLIWRIIW
jgi:hypothetical protein